MNLNDQFKVVCENIWLPHFFEMIVTCIRADGGDGWGAVISDDYEYLAKEFEEWDKANSKFPFKIRRDANNIHFEDGFEGITFTNKESQNGWSGTYVFRIEKQSEFENDIIKTYKKTFEQV